MQALSLVSRRFALPTKSRSTTHPSEAATEVLAAAMEVLAAAALGETSF